MTLAATIQHLRELMAKATPAPWRDDADLSPDDVTIFAGPRGADATFIANIGEMNPKPVGLVFDMDAHNGRLVAAMRNALPEVLDAAEESEGRIALLKDWDADCGKLQVLLDAALKRAHDAEKEREDRIDLDVAKRTVMIQAQLAAVTKERDDAKAAIMEALGNGMDEDAWPPGTDYIAAAVVRIRGNPTLTRVLTKDLGETQAALDGCRNQNFVLSSDRDNLKEALRRYGFHVHDCDAIRPHSGKQAPCTCGFKRAWDEWVEGKA